MVSIHVRFFSVSFLFFTLVLFGLTTHAQTVISVSSTADSGPGTLREAITTANLNTAVSYRITLPASQTISLTAALPDILFSGTIAGGSTLCPATGVGGSTLTQTGVSTPLLRFGSTSRTRTIIGIAFVGGAGALESSGNANDLIVQQCLFQANTTNPVFSRSSTRNLTITDSYFDNNAISTSVKAIYSNNTGTTIINRCSFRQQGTSGVGSETSVLLYGVQIAQINNCTFGGTGNLDGTSASLISVNSLPSRPSSVTFSHNTLGLRSRYAFDISQDTSPANVSLQNNIVTSSTNGTFIALSGPGATITSLGGNVFANDITSSLTLLASDKDNVGLAGLGLSSLTTVAGECIPTIPLTCFSQAIDAAVSSTLTTDALGIAQIGTARDAGAYESSNAASVTFTVASSPSVCGFNSATLTASGCTGGTVNWPGGITGNIYLATISGTYTATCTVGSCSTTANVTATVKPTSFTVTSLTNTGAGTLRQAFADIGASSCTDQFTITFGVSGTVNLASTLTAPAKNILLLGYSTNSTDVALRGGGSSSNYRLLTVPGSATLAVRYLSFTNARVGAGENGGAISLDGGRLQLAHCYLYGNTAGNFGGAMYGGGSFTITNSTFASNTAISNSGALHKGTTNPGLIDNCTFSGNVGRSGGAIEASVGSLTISNSTFTGNRAVGSPVNNAPSSEGGGIYGGNGANVVTINNCLIAGNTSVGASPDLVSGFNSTTGYNLIGNTSGATLNPDLTGNVTGVSAAIVLNSTLATNGGSSPTHSLVVGGSAYNAGPPTSTDPDQRGLAVFGGRRDIGAFESQTPALSATVGSVSAVCGTNGGFSLSVSGGSLSGYSYRLSNAGSFTSLPANPYSVLVSSPGTYSVSVRDGAGIISGPVLVTVLAGASASSFTVESVAVCSGQLATLTAVGCSGGTVAWPDGSTGDTFSSSVTGLYTATCTIDCSTMATARIAAINGIVYVTQTGAGFRDGTSWTNALPGTALQQGIDLAGNCGAQVWVAAGIYKPTTSTVAADRQISFTMRPNVAIYGGFAGITSETSVNGRLVNPTTGQPSSSTLSGDLGTPNNMSDNSLHVIKNILALTNTAILDGFVITGGNSPAGGPVADGFPGGGMVNVDYYGECSPLIRNCLFQGNYAAGGGGMGNSGSTNGVNPQLINCVFRANTAGDGGGLYNVDYASPTITNTLFENNTATLGGAVYNRILNSGFTNNARFINTTFRTNTATDPDNGGGALVNINQTSSILRPQLINCAFLGNTAPKGGAISSIGLSGGAAQYELTNCSFQNNRAGSGEVLFHTLISGGSSTAELVNCVLFGNGSTPSFVSANGGTKPVIRYSLLQNTIAGSSYTDNGNNLNTSTSPFVNTTSVALNSCASAINTGQNSATGLSGITTDLASNPRLFGGIVDMGAVEFQSTANGQTAFTTQPAAGSGVCPGATVTASVSVSGTGPFSYQWYRNGAALTGITSATTASLALSNVTSASAGSYSVVVTGACNSVTSTAFSLTVNPLPTAGLVNNGPLTCAQTSVTLTASGGVSYTFANAGGIIGTPGASTTQTVSSADTYSVMVANANGCISSTTTSVGSNTAVPSLTLTANNACLGQSVTLTATGGLSAYTFTGASGVVGTAGQTAQTAIVPGLSAGSYGFTVVATNATGCSNSATATGTLITSLLTVTSTADSGPGTLREAITTANANPTCGPFLITLPDSQTITLTATLPTITFSGSIVGGSTLCPATGVGGSTLTRDPTAGEFRLLNLFKIGTNSLGLSDITFLNGKLTGAGTAGGAILANGYALSIGRCVFRNNQASAGGAILANRAAEINDSFFDNNIAIPASALAIENTGQAVRIERTSFRQTTDGGFTTSSLLNLGVSSGVIRNCTFGGGGLFPATQAISLNAVTSIPMSVTLEHNTFALRGNYLIFANAFNANTSVTLQNNVFTASFSTGTALGTNNGTGTATFTSLGGNVFANDITSNLPLLASDRDNVGMAGLALGSLTALSGECIPTIPLGCFSQAIDAAVSSTLTTDARGVAELGAARDAGAFESSNPASLTFTVASSASVCAGNSVTLTASGCTSGTVNWPGGITGNTFSTSTAGVYTATCTVGACSTTASGTATISAQPSIQVFPASVALTCSAPVVSLTAGGTGTYRWSTSETTQVISVSTAGTYSVTLTGVNGCTAAASGAVSDNFTSPSASLLASGPITCSATLVTLTATSGIGQSFSFSSGVTGIGSTGPTSRTALVTVGGLYSVTVVGLNGCTSTASVSVSQNTVLPTLTLTASTVCAGQSVTLTATSGLNSYTFSGDGSVGIQIGGSNTLSLLQGVGSFSFSVTGVNAGGCTATASATAVVVTNNLVVTSTADSGPGTLREAITTANANPACGPFLITLPDSQTITLTATLPTITFSGSIVGGSTLCPATGVGGSTLARTGSAEFRLLTQPSGSLLIRDLVLQNGDAPSSDDVGGAIKTENASLTVLNCTFPRNTAGTGGAIANFTSTLFIDQTLFDDNAGSLGSALTNSFAGTTHLSRSTIQQQTGNSTSLVDNLEGTVRIVNCTLASSTFNTALIRLNGFYGPSSLSVVHTTFQAPNTNHMIGAARYATAQSLYLQNTIFGPAALQTLLFDGSAGSLAVTSGGGNVFAGNATAGNNANGTYTLDPTDKNNVGTAGLAIGSLMALSGECIPTIPLACFSQAIDAAVSSGVTADARGIAQLGAARDAGAYESNNPASVTFTVVSSASACGIESVTLTASGCTGGTVNWPGGITGNVFSTSISGTYTATCTIGTCSTTVSSTVGANHPDYQALVDLYTSTNGPNWGNKDGWLQGCDPCTGNAGNPWYGLLCSAGRVRYIEMPANQLNGTIPGSLSALTMLDFLDLRSNQLSGSIPASLSTLTRLTHLILNNNQLSGSIPASLSALTSLEFLYLFRNQLTGSIPASLSALTNLQTIRLQNNLLTGSIPASLSAITSLIEVDLSSNQLSGPIPVGFSALTSLKFLYLQTNQLSGPIPASLSSLTSLIEFYAFNNQLSGCYPASLTAFCGITRSFANNPGLPGGGSNAAFAAFCSTGAGSDAFVASATASRSTALVGNAVSLSTSGGSFGTPTSYSWTAPPGVLLSSPSTTSVVSATLTSAGEQVFTVVVGFGGSCTHTATVSVTGVLPASIVGFAATTGGVCTGSVATFTATVGNLTGAYDFTLTNGISTTNGTVGSSAFSQTWTTIGSGLQTFTLTVAQGGLSQTATTTLTVGAAITATLSANPGDIITCAVPAVTLTASGGNSYVFSGLTVVASSGSSATVNADGIYSVTVTNTATGCSSVTTTTVSSNTTAPTLSFAASNSLNCSITSATLTATATGFGALTYAFRNMSGSLAGSPSSNSMVVVSTGGSYSVLVTAANGCTTGQSTSVVSDTALPTVSIMPTSATLTCSQPSLTLTATSSETVLRWSTGATSTTLLVNTAGNYSVTATAPNGCTVASNTVVVVSNTALTGFAVTTSASLCAGVGSVTLTTSGCTSGTVAWPGGITGNTYSTSVAGVYTATCTVGTCSTTASGTATIGASPTATLSANLSGTLTCTQTSLTLTATGGISYTFASASGSGIVSQNMTAGTAVINQSGTYTVTVGNANGCTSTTSVAISQSASLPTAGLVVSGTITCTVTAVTLTASGGNSYAFAGPLGGPTGVVASSGNSATANVGGVYSVTVTNTATGCSSVTTTTISSNTTAPTVSINPTSGTLTCAVTSLTLTATSSGMGLLWSNAATTQSITVNSGGTYSVTATGGAGHPGNGCTSTTSVVVSQSAGVPTADLVASGTLTCFVTVVTLTASGGNSYAFGGPGVVTSSGSSATVNAEGLYSVTVTNTATGCFSTTNVTVYGNLAGAAPIPTLTSSGSAVCPGANLFITATVSGTASAFQWFRNGILVSNSGPTLSLFNVDVAQGGSYVLVVTGGCGSATSTAFSLTVKPAPVVTLSLLNSGAVLQATGGMLYERVIVIDRINGYEIRQTDSSSTGFFTITRPGAYRLVVTGANGCKTEVESSITSLPR